MLSYSRMVVGQLQLALHLQGLLTASLTCNTRPTEELECCNTLLGPCML